MESARFQNINTEFLTVMKKVYKSPFILDVMNQPGIQKSLERLADLLNKIQKALGEYLERERASFPRFYFVGDEDLLEIIGNSKDILRIMKHLKKMFAGISTIILDDDLTQILGLASREGEEVRFKELISLKEYPKINDWLTKLESEMRRSLAVLLCQSVSELQVFYGSGLEIEPFMGWMEKYPAQLVTLAIQVAWTSSVEASFQQGSTPEDSLNTIQKGLELLADVVLTGLAPVTRRKCEHLITELVHQRDITRTLIQQRISDNAAFAWLYQMRFYLDPGASNPLNSLSIRVSDTSFPYGWEYLGVPDRLVQTPLTDRCYLTLTQALDAQLGGAPFGPAGTGEFFKVEHISRLFIPCQTGKTESVKALGVQLGRFVLVFCCDETFDFQAMGRIFLGLCQVGAWGCFDEFNRLEERILSAVSQQVQTIQQGLVATAKNPNVEIELVGKNLKINPNIGVYSRITAISVLLTVMCRCIHHHKSELRWPITITPQLDKAIQTVCISSTLIRLSCSCLANQLQRGHDSPRSGTDRPSHVVLPRFPHRRIARFEDCALLQPLRRAALTSTSLRLWSSSFEGGVG